MIDKATAKISPTEAALILVKAAFKYLLLVIFFSYIIKTGTNITDGILTAVVAARAPKKPPYNCPTYVAELMAIGPGN